MESPSEMLSIGPAGAIGSGKRLDVIEFFKDVYFLTTRAHRLTIIPRDLVVLCILCI